MAEPYETATYDIAVIGYGPTGATAANLLGGLGLKVVVIERDSDIYGRARAISTDEEVMRIWQSVGLADRLQADMLPNRPVAFVDADGVAFMESHWPAAGPGTPPSSSCTSPRSTRCCGRVWHDSRTVEVLLNTSACAS